MKAIEFELQNTDERWVNFNDYKGKKLILFFYPKANTSGCTQEAIMFKDSYDEFKNLGFEILGVSKDSIKANKKFKDNNELPYDLLSDIDTKLVTEYDIYKEKSMYGKKYMGVIRTTLIIDENQDIVKRYDKVKIKGHIEEILDFIKTEMK